MVLEFADLPLPMLLMKPGGSAAATPSLLRLLERERLDPGELDRFEVRDQDGEPLESDSLPWRRAARGEEFEEHERWLDPGTGREFDLRVQAHRLADGTVLNFEPVSAPVDPRMPERLAALPGRLAELLLGAETPRRASTAAAEVVRAAFDCAGTFLLLRDAGRPRLWAVAGFAHDETVVWTTSGAGGVIVELVERQEGDEPFKEPRLAGRHDLPWARWLVERGARSFAAAPLLDEGSLAGVLCLARRTEGPLSGIEAAALGSVTRLWSGTLVRAHARDAETRARRALRVVTEAALGRESSTPLRDLLKLLIEQACMMTGARYGAMGVLNPERTALEDFIVVGVSDERAARIGTLPTGKGLLGAVIAERRTIRVSDIRRDPRSSGFPPHHPRMTSFLGVPLHVGGEIFGNFYLSDKENGAEFDEDDAEQLEALSAQASLTVSYARKTGEQGRMLDAVLRHAPHAILFVTGEESIVFHNTAAQGMLGLELGAARLDQAFQLAEPDGPPLAREARPAMRALRGEVVSDQQLQLLRPKAPPLPVLVNSAPVWTETGALLGAVLTLQDISAFKELASLREELTAVVAHDLRNPLQALTMQLEVLLRGADGEEARVPVATLQRMRKSGERLTRLIAELLDASRVDSNGVVLERHPVSLPEIIETLLRQIEPTLGNHRAELRIEDAPPRVSADPARLDQILTNLIVNAAKYSEDRSPIVLTVAPSGRGARVSISDRGPGIAPEDLPRLFDRYYQSLRARQKKSGLGLGLYITKGLVDAHDGRIWAESEPGRGSTFHVWLPEAR